MWNCTHFRHPTDEQLGHVDTFFSNYYNLQSVYFELDRSFLLALIYVAVWSNHTVINFKGNYFETYFCQVFILKKILKNRIFGFLVPNAW